MLPEEEPVTGEELATAQELARQQMDQDDLAIEQTGVQAFRRG